MTLNPQMAALLRLAEEALTRGEQFAAAAEAWIQADKANHASLTFVDRMLAAVGLKMLATFRALVDDASTGRGEAMHHLKTLCETFIYSFEVSAGEDRAALVLAAALKGRARYWRSNPGVMTPQVMADLDEEIRDLSKGRPLPTNVKSVAEKHHNLPAWYDSVYRLACEPAHISDIDDFLLTSRMGGSREVQSPIAHIVRGLPSSGD